MKQFLIIICLIAMPVLSVGQRQITFPSEDSLTITADLYEQDVDFPYVVFFHQAGSSRGEFREIAPRFLKMGYNALVVDLRSGKESNYVQNQTSAKANELNLPREMIDARQDIRAAVHYAQRLKNNQTVIVLGSSYSASLVLEEAAGDSLISAVIAFSPGEYFRGHSVKDSIEGLSIPYFVSGSKPEKDYIYELLSKTSSPTGIIFIPETGAGRHGASSLWSDNKNSSEYWLALVMFIRSLGNN
ncbi:MAG: dienelactone hydrolase family protein [Bacteroidota bacterium]|nr:dienelactone hydrolase family protein [Bacteroidota bacterium]